MGNWKTKRLGINQTIDKLWYLLQKGQTWLSTKHSKLLVPENYRAYRARKKREKKKIKEKLKFLNNSIHKLDIQNLIKNGTFLFSNRLNNFSFI